MSSPTTILLVEDEPLLLKYVGTVLTRAGYRVLPAASPQEANRIEQAFTGTIDLLLTGGFVPKSSGPRLAAQVARRRPGLRVMLMSSDPCAGTLADCNGWLFTEKPFWPSTLLGGINAGLASEAPV